MGFEKGQRVLRVVGGEPTQETGTVEFVYDPQAYAARREFPYMVVWDRIGREICAEDELQAIEVGHKDV